MSSRNATNGGILSQTPLNSCISKKMMSVKIFSFSLVGMILIPTILLSQSPNSGFSNPLPDNNGVSSVFGEPRTDHFHSGIDFRTNGDTGMVVVAPYDGWLSRIKVSTLGYGNVVYIDHPNGYTTVYGHLERFSAKLEDYVDGLQYEQQKWDIEDFPEPGLLCIQKGDTIGFSGNTGGSTGPHLHYEVRISKNQHPIDPLSQGFYDLKDETAPQIKRLVLYEVVGYGDTVLFRRIRGIKTNREGGVGYSANLDKEKLLPKRIAFGIIADDKIDNQKGTFDVTYGSLKQNGKMDFAFKLTEFSYAETRYANAFTDYEAKSLKYGEIIKLFRESNDPLSIYSVNVNGGIFELDTTKTESFEISVADHNRNVSSLRFNLSPKHLYNPAPLVINNPKTQIIVEPLKSATLTMGGVTATIPANALYGPAIVELGDTSCQCNQSLCKAFFVGSPTIALQRPIKIEVNLKMLGIKTTDRIYVARFTRSRRIAYAGGIVSEDSTITMETRNFGVFTIARDTTPPLLQATNFSDGDNVDGEQYLMFKIDDEDTGIASYSAFVDGKWVAVAYEPKEKQLRLKLSAKHIQPGITHIIMIQCTDLLGNKTEKNYGFHW